MFRKKLAEKGLKIYKGAISPLFISTCRHVPTCSEYAAQAMIKHGILKGTVKAIWRIIRCNPLSKGGYDPA